MGRLHYSISDRNPLTREMTTAEGITVRIVRDQFISLSTGSWLTFYTVYVPSHPPVQFIRRLRSARKIAARKAESVVGHVYGTPFCGCENCNKPLKA
jgi:hypothetical protein